MIQSKLMRHIKKLCLKNLRSDRAVCCAECPFEEEIVAAAPSTKELFKAKRRRIKMKATNDGGLLR